MGNGQGRLFTAQDHISVACTEKYITPTQGSISVNVVECYTQQRVLKGGTYE